MEVRLQPDKEAQDDTRFIEAVNIGLAAADCGDFVEHKGVGANLQKILMRARLALAQLPS